MSGFKQRVWDLGVKMSSGLWFAICRSCLVRLSFSHSSAPSLAFKHTLAHSLRLSMSLSLYMSRAGPSASLSLSLARALSLAHTSSLILYVALSLSLALFLSHTHAHSLSMSLAVSFSLTHTHTLSRYVSRSLYLCVTGGSRRVDAKPPPKMPECSGALLPPA